MIQLPSYPRKRDNSRFCEEHDGEDEAGDEIDMEVDLDEALLQGSSNLSNCSRPS